MRIYRKWLVRSSTVSLILERARLVTRTRTRDLSLSSLASILFTWQPELWWDREVNLYLSRRLSLDIFVTPSLLLTPYHIYNTQWWTCKDGVSTLHALGWNSRVRKTDVVISKNVVPFFLVNSGFLYVTALAVLELLCRPSWPQIHGDPSASWVLGLRCEPVSLEGVVL